MKVILILASTLGKDGTSQFITYFVNYFTKQSGYKIVLLFLRDVDAAFLSKIDNGAEVITLSAKGPLIGVFFRLIKNIFKIKPDYCLLGFTQLVYLGYLAPLLHLIKAKILLRDTIIPSLFHKNDGLCRRLFVKYAYKQFDSIIAQSLDMAYDLTNNWGVKSNKIKVINNPIDIKKYQNFAKYCPEELENKKVFTFVAAGRITEQKGYDIIIERFSQLEKINCKLLIIGTGELEEYIYELIQKNNLNENISLIGYRTNVAEYLKYCDALLLCSRYEGFPNIVLEANSLGKPVFTNNCKGGINEIIIEGKNGISCNFYNQDEFETNLLKFININFDSKEIIKLTEERYDINIIMNKYKLFLC